MVELGIVEGFTEDGIVSASYEALKSNPYKVIVSHCFAVAVNNWPDNKSNANSLVSACRDYYWGTNQGSENTNNNRPCNFAPVGSVSFFTCCNDTKLGF